MGALIKWVISARLPRCNQVLSMEVTIHEDGDTRLALSSWLTGYGTGDERRH
jgi:hypothetical protein